jgi:hypothetical protein
MPDKNQLPCGHIIDHYEPIQEKIVDTKTGAVTVVYKKDASGKNSLKRHVKGDAEYRGGSQALCKADGNSYTFLPGRWVLNRPREPPPSELVGE